jgi:hypothetical protein
MIIALAKIGIGEVFFCGRVFVQYYYVFVRSILRRIGATDGAD